MLVHLLALLLLKRNARSRRRFAFARHAHHRAQPLPEVIRSRYAVRSSRTLLQILQSLTM